MKLSRGMLISGGVVSVLVAAYVFGLLIPGQRKLKGLRQEMESIQAALQAEQEAVKQLSLVYSEVSQLAGRLSEFHHAVPCNHEFADAYRTLSELIEQSGLRRLAIQPGRAHPLPERLRHVRESGIRATMVQPVEIEGEGTTAGVVRLVAALDAWRRLNRIERLQLRPVEGSWRSMPGGHAEPVVRCSILLHMYFGPRDEDGRVVVAAAGTGSLEPARP